jgi:ATP-dependent Zn protease
VGINVITQPMRTASGIMNKTFNADNVLTNYTWFHDSHAVYLSRVNQIKVSAKQYNDETNEEEKRKIRMELNAQKQSCRDLVTRYNANSVNTSKGIFKGQTAPEILNISTCEG